MPPAFTDVCTALPTALPTVQETGCVSVHVTAGFPELARIQSAEIGSVVVALYCCLMILPPYLSPALPTLPPVFPLSLPPSPSSFLPSLPYAHPFASHYFPPFLLPSPPPSFYFQFPSFILSFFLFSPLFFQLFLPLLFFLFFSPFFKHLIIDTLSSKFGCLHGWKNQSVGPE